MEENLNKEELKDLCHLMKETAAGNSISRDDTNGMSKNTLNAFVNKLDNLGI